MFYFVVPPVQPKSECDGIGLALPDVLDKNVRQQDTLDEKINGIEIARDCPPFTSASHKTSTYPGAGRHSCFSSINRFDPCSLHATPAVPNGVNRL
ncbi:hypothetical protein [Paraburkholderia xenovorans]